MGIGWGTVFGKIADWFPSKKEKILNDIKALERKIDDLQKNPNTPNYARLYDELATRLRNKREELKNLQ